MRDGRGAVGACACDLQHRVFSVEAGDDGTGLDSIALVHAQIDDPATDFGSGVDLGRLDVSGDAQSIAGWSRRARRQEGRHSEHEQTRDGHDVFRSMPRTEACI